MFQRCPRTHTLYVLSVPNIPSTDSSLVRPQTPHRPFRLPPLPAPHRTAQPETRHWNLYLAPAHAPKLHNQQGLSLHPLHCLCPLRHLGPRRAIPSRRVFWLFRWWLQFRLTAQRRLGRSDAPGRRRRSGAWRMAACERYKESAGLWQDSVAGGYHWECGGGWEWGVCGWAWEVAG